MGQLGRRVFEGWDSVMTANTAMVKFGSVVAITATLITVGTAGCSKNKSGTVASPTTGTPSSAAAPATTSPTASAAPSATASARFVGHWQRHASTLDITPTTATLSAGLGMGGCSQGQAACSETDTLGVVSGDDTQLTLTVTAVSYGLNNGQTTSVNPSPGPSTAVGDSIQLVSRAPGLIKQTVLHGFPGWQGDLYWCGTGVSPTDQQQCGA
jgi:hypothetical protein